MRVVKTLFAATVLVAAASANALQIDTVTDRLARPWSISLLNDQQAFVTEKEGSLQLVDLGNGSMREIDGMPEVFTESQAGLLGTVLHPDFANNGWFYVSYVKPLGDDKTTTAVMRFTFDGEKITDRKAIFEAAIDSDNKGHFGSRMVFDNDGLLYISLGDRRNRPAVQDMTQHNGKLIRLNDDGSIPASNPFASGSSVEQPIFSLGHRNVQGLAVRDDGSLWNSEHGPRGGDEINKLVPGANYGWPVITFGKEYIGGDIGEGTHKEGMVQPIHYYVPSIATSDMVFYRGEEFPEWQGNLLLTSLAGSHLNRLVFSGDEVVEESRHLEALKERLRDIALDSLGHIYLITDSGKLLRISKD